MTKLITISGLDGSGKSTQINLLKEYLRSKDKSFYHFHAINFSIANIFRRPTSKEKKSAIKANWLQIQLRKIALLIDILRFRRLVRKLRVDYIISDRYFYDSLVNINYLETKFPSKLWAEKFIPKPNTAFYLKVSPRTIMRRERPPDQGLEYLIKKEKIYDRKVRNWGMVFLDGEKNKKEVFELILRFLS